jgi:hypothetical protein
MHRDDLLEAPAPAPQHGSLLEDWPRRASSREAEADQDRDGQGQGDGGSQSQSQSRVYFSEISMLHVYDDFDYMHVKKGYSKQDREIFTAQAIVEANRIRNLIIASPPDSVSESIKFLAENNLITREELVGIDHLIGRRIRVMQVRRNHMAAVLWKQHEQRRQQQLGEDSVIDLGKFAAQSSLKSTHHAIARASLVSSSPQNQDSLEHHRLHCFD